jgi:hypothetical protein
MRMRSLALLFVVLGACDLDLSKRGMQLACSNVQVMSVCNMVQPPCPNSNGPSCGIGHCPANSSCTGGGGCSCNSGYDDVFCDGTPCNGNCTGGVAWYCKTSGTPDTKPGCLDDPSAVIATCACQDGTNLVTTCGDTTTCETRCEQNSATHAP